MPVTVEEVRQPSDQDLEDLQKIYEDAPSWMLEDWPSSSHQQAIKRLIESTRKDKAHKLFAARFNNRLLGAIMVDEAPDYWLLHGLCVRNLTRSRGVGGRLLEQVVNKARESGKRIQLHDPQRQLRHEQLQSTIGDYELTARIDT
ncbi:aspartate 1-decarboxylase autocleavage activator PanM [Endozoicomonas sp. Mp262]|uniref:aspartate 1-decarboxylase autocleavage activator PanM n=1 Tax=Endozoicomonas sp. Mp262 TaxID=2919499 RepID=UPI0021DA0D3F